MKNICNRAIVYVRCSIVLLRSDLVEVRELNTQYERRLGHKQRALNGVPAP